MLPIPVDGTVSRVSVPLVSVPLVSGPAVSACGTSVGAATSSAVEVAVDGVQVSSRYPGGVALRFARVKRYRADKAPADADTIATVRALL